jgi:3-dehydroquinate synthase class II
MTIGIYTSGPEGIGCVDVGIIRLDRDWTLIPVAELTALKQELEDAKLLIAAISLQHAEYLNEP